MNILGKIASTCKSNPPPPRAGRVDQVTLADRPEHWDEVTVGKIESLRQSITGSRTTVAILGVLLSLAAPYIKAEISPGEIDGALVLIGNSLAAVAALRGLWTNAARRWQPKAPTLDALTGQLVADAPDELPQAFNRSGQPVGALLGRITQQKAMAPPATVDWDALRAMDAPSPFAIAEPSALSEHPAPRASAEAEAETLAVLTAPAPTPVPIVGLTQSDRDKLASEAIDAGVDPAAVLDHVEAMADRLGPQVLLYYGRAFIAKAAAVQPQPAAA